MRFTLTAIYLSFMTFFGLWVLLPLFGAGPGLIGLMGRQPLPPAVYIGFLTIVGAMAILHWTLFLSIVCDRSDESSSLLPRFLVISLPLGLQALVIVGLIAYLPSSVRDLWIRAWEGMWFSGVGERSYANDVNFEGDWFMTVVYTTAAFVIGFGLQMPFIRSPRAWHRFFSCRSLFLVSLILCTLAGIIFWIDLSRTKMPDGYWRWPPYNLLMLSILNMMWWLGCNLMVDHPSKEHSKPNAARPTA